MSDRLIDTVTRRLAAAMQSRRGVLRLGASAALAGLALGADEVAAACRRPKRSCDKGNQCCTGKCKKGKCAMCPAATVYVSGRDAGCWPWVTWGSNGSGDGQFITPVGVAVGAAGHVYVADSSNHRMVRVRPL